MRKHLLTPLICAATAAGVSLLAGCRAKPQPPEPIPAAAPLAMNTFAKSWATNLTLPAGEKVQEVHARDNDIYIYTSGDQVFALSRDAGKPRWSAQVRTNSRGGLRPPVVLKDAVVVPTSGTLEVFEPNEGRLVKSIKMTVASRSNAIGSGKMVFLGGDEEGSGRFVAMDITRPYVANVWELMIPKGGLASTPAMVEDVIYLAGGNGYVYAVDAGTREALWPLPDNAFKTEGRITGDLAVDEKSLYVASTDSRLYCLNRGNGKLQWQYYSGVALDKGPIVTATNVYLPLLDKGIAAFDKNSGDINRRPLWIGLGMEQVLTEDAKFVYLRRRGDNAIVAFDKQTGSQVFESKRRDLIAFATNTKSDGVIFAASKTNRVLAIKPVLRPGVVGELVLEDTDLTDEVMAVASAK